MKHKFETHPSINPKKDYNQMQLLLPDLLSRWNCNNSTPEDYFSHEKIDVRKEFVIFTQLVSVAFNHVHLFRRVTKTFFYEEK